jgi:hypothetical protein
VFASCSSSFSKKGMTCIFVILFYKSKKFNKAKFTPYF